MDIMIHILIIVLIGSFIFLNNKIGDSQNPVFIVAVLSILGIIFLMQTPVEIIDYSKSIVDTSGAMSIVYHPAIDISDLALGPATGKTFFWMFYIMTFITSSMLLFGVFDTKKRSNNN